MATDDHDLGEVVDLVNEVGEDDAKEIIDIADDHGLDLEQANKVKVKKETNEICVNSFFMIFFIFYL